MLARTLASAALLALPLATGCTRKTSDRDLVYLKPFEAIEKSNAAPGLFDRERRTAWIDPRTPEQYAAEHIPGAISLPFPRIPTEAPIVLKGYDQFVVYDTDYDDTIGRAAAKRLMEEGFDDVYSLTGGLKAWKQEDNPTVRDPNAAKTDPKAKGADGKGKPDAPASKGSASSAPASAPPASAPPSTGPSAAPKG